MLTIEKHIEAKHSILLLKGEVDASNSVILDEAITETVRSGATHILIDGTELEYISSAGLGVFISYLEDFMDSGISMKIFGLSPKVFEVFKILGLDQLISILPDKASALSQ